MAPAIEHARQLGKRVLAVVAGHMHWRTKAGEQRSWQIEKEGTVYVNAARVPRIFSTRENVMRHHVALTVRPGGISAKEVLVPEHG